MKYKTKTIFRTILFFLLISIPYGHAENSDDPKDGYTINYNNVSLVEYVRFVSKICNTNFIFNEQELQYNVTVVSDAPITPENVMSTLIQILRTRGLELLEQGDSLVIHPLDNVKQLATVVTSDDQEVTAPIQTRVFRVHNTKVASVAQIIRSMISASAILEISEETRQIIITDITTNIEKISTLIESLDSPQIPMEIATYRVKKGEMEYMIALTKQVMDPLAQGNPLIFVPHEPAQVIYIVSTPLLVEKSVAILSNIDVEHKLAPGKLKADNIFIYHPKNRSGPELKKALLDMAEGLQETGFNEQTLIASIKQVRWISETDTLIFTGPKDAITQLKEMIPTLDSPFSPHESSDHEQSTFLMYHPKFVTAQDVYRSVHEIAEHLSKSKSKDTPLIKTLDSAKVVDSTDSILFTGTPSTFKRLHDILNTIDIATTEKEEQLIHKEFLIYKIQHANRKDLQKYLEQVAKNLKSKGGSEGLVNTIDSMKWIKESNSFMFLGSENNLARLKELLNSYDSPAIAKQKGGYYVYPLKYVPGNVIEDDLEKFAKQLKKSDAEDPNLIRTLERTKWIAETNSMMITGDEQSIEEVKKIIEKYDVERSAAELGKQSRSNFFLYKPMHLPPEVFKKSIKEIVDHLKKSKLSDPNLIHSLEDVKYTEATKSFIFTGNPETIEKVKVILKDIDLESNVPSSIQRVGETTYLLYKLQHASPAQIIHSIKNITKDLKKSGTSDTQFLDALKSMKYVKDTNSLLFTGAPEALEKVQALAQKFDNPALAVGTKEMKSSEPPGSFFVYKPKYVSGELLEQHVDEFGDHLKQTGLHDPDLFQTIQSIRWVENSNSLIITGSPKSIETVKNLIESFDIPSKADLAQQDIEPSIQDVDKTSFLVYKLQYHKGNEIQTALKQIGTDLIKNQAMVSKELLNSIESIQWIKITNSLLCTGDNATLKRLQELIKTLDIPLKQVFIEMLVIDTDTRNNMAFGLDWGGKAKYRDKLAGSYGNISPTSPSSSLGTTNTATESFTDSLQNISATNTPQGTDIPLPSAASLGIIGDVILHKGQTFFSLGSLLVALEDDRDTTVVTTPKLVTQDGKTSKIFIGRNIPYTGSFVSNTTGNASSTIQTFNLEYRDVGVDMTITPVLGNSDMVTLDLILERTQTTSEVSSQINFNTNTAQGITTDKTSMNTTVHVPNKHFLILSGMVISNKTEQKSGIPCLGGLPWLGAAFSRSDQTDSTRNVVIFLRPHILNNFNDMKSVTEDQEDFFRENAGSPRAEQQFEEAMEMIKSPNDE